MLEHTNRAGAPLSADSDRQRRPRGYLSRIEVYRPVASGEACIQIGEDVRGGEPILRRGIRFAPRTSAGCSPWASPRWRWRAATRGGIVSQGDEVVPPDQEPAPGQVRDINSYTLAGLVRRAGGIPLIYPIAPDRQEALDAAVKARV